MALFPAAAGFSCPLLYNPDADSFVTVTRRFGDLGGISCDLRSARKNARIRPNMQQRSPKLGGKNLECCRTTHAMLLHAHGALRPSAIPRRRAPPPTLRRADGNGRL